MSLFHLQPGDTVIVTDDNERHYKLGKLLPPPGHECPVIKVGRKLLHVRTGYGPATFDLRGGHETGQGVNTRHCYTLTEFADLRERNEVLNALRTEGVTFRNDNILTLANLRELLGWITNESTR